MFSTYQNQVCIITGSSSGLGVGFAQELAKQSAKVVLFARRGERLYTLASELPSESLVVVGDVNNPQDRANLIHQTLNRWGRIDALINNAGIEDRARFEKLPIDEIIRVLETNLTSLLLLTHAVIPIMQAQKSGLILNVSSAMGDINIPRSFVYGVSKAGLSAFSLSLYRSLKPYGIHVMDFIPGYTRSEIVPEELDKKLPRFVKVKSAEYTAAAALRAALKQKPRSTSAEATVRLLMWTNRSFPRIADVLIKRIWR